MKKLIFELTEGITRRKAFAAELVTALNEVLTRFKSSHNHFGQPIDEDFAFMLISDPLGTFDDLLRANAPFKAIAGKPLDAERLAEITGIDRAGFIQAFTVTLPGTRDKYNRTGRAGLLQLTAVNRPLVMWRDGAFALNEKQLEADCERFRTYAETSDQLAEVKFWEDLAATMNACLDKHIIDRHDVWPMAQRLKLKDTNGRFVPDYSEIAKTMKDFALVN